MPLPYLIQYLLQVLLEIQGLMEQAVLQVLLLDSQTAILIHCLELHLLFPLRP